MNQEPLPSPARQPLRPCRASRPSAGLVALLLLASAGCHHDSPPQPGTTSVQPAAATPEPTAQASPAPLPPPPFKVRPPILDWKQGNETVVAARDSALQHCLQPLILDPHGDRGGVVRIYYGVDSHVHLKLTRTMYKGKPLDCCTECIRGTLAQIIGVRPPPWDAQAELLHFEFWKKPQ